MLKNPKIRKLAIVVIIISLIIVAAGCNLVQMNPSAKKKQVVAEIEEYKITQQDLNYYFALEKINWKIKDEVFPTGEEEIIQIKTEILDILVGSEVLVYLAKQDGITVDEERVKSDASATRRMIINQLVEGESYEEFLAEEDITTEEFDDFIHGYSMVKQYIEGLREKVMEGNSISDDESKEFYEKNINLFDISTVTAKHILADKDHKELIEEIAKKAKDGEDFDKLIEEYNNQEGILEATDLGEFQKAQMVPEFSETAFALEAGESAIVETSFGFHVIKVVDKDDQPIQAFEEVKEEISQHLKQTAFMKYIEEKEEELDIKKYEDKL